MLTAKGSKNEIYFTTPNLDEALLKSEAIAAETVESFTHEVEVLEKNKPVLKKVKRSALDWHVLVTRDQEVLKENDVLKTLNSWGLKVKENSLAPMENILKTKRNKYIRDMMPIGEFEKTQEYQKALHFIKEHYSKPLKDGRVVFDYQMEGIALIMSLKRMILAFDMGLGKTMTSLIGVTANPANHKILIITMSRNIGDWIKEMNVLNLENDYKVLESPADLQSEERIHVVSYEKWSRDRIVFINKLHEECPNCKSSLSYNGHLQYCKLCKKKSEPIDEQYSEKDLPAKCPGCKEDWKQHKHFCECGFSVVKQKKKALSSYFHRGYDACVVDESHYLKNGASKRSKSVVRKVKTKTRVLLSGTPAEQGAEDFYWQLAWIMGDSYFFEDPYKLRKFANYGRVGEEHFRVFYGGGSKKAVFDSSSIEPRISHQEQLWRLQDSVMLRKDKQDSDVSKDIKVPKPEHSRVHLPLNEADHNLYEEIKLQFKSWYEEEYAKKIAAEARGDKYRISTIVICQWMDKLRKAASSPWTFEEYVPDSEDIPTKLKYLQEKSKEYLRRHKKILVFTSHKKTAEELGVLLDGFMPGKEAAYIHGSVDIKYRYELMDRFQDPNDNLSILVMTMKTGAESYTLTEAKSVFLYDLDFNAKKIEQCYSRAVRLGQRDVVDIHWLLAIDTIDINMHALVLSKLSGVDLAVDRKELDFEAISKKFVGDETLEMDELDYETFAAEMLKRGTSRSQISA
jgi:SNF2 family DNA or RNA helicase